MKLGLQQLRELGGQIEVLKTYYARLSDRERYIVLGSAAGGILFLMLLVYSALAAATASMASRIETSRLNLKRMNDVRAAYQQTERQIRDLEQMIRRTPSGFQLATHVEQLSARSGIKIDSIKERAGPPNNIYKETQAEISVRQVSLRSLIQFLFDIENSQELLRIGTLKVRPNFQDPTQLNVTFVVSTFRPSEAP